MLGQTRHGWLRDWAFYLVAGLSVTTGGYFQSPTSASNMLSTYKDKPNTTILFLTRIEVTRLRMRTFVDSLLYVVRRVGEDWTGGQSRLIGSVRPCEQ